MSTPPAAGGATADHARRLWQELAGPDVTFPVDGTTRVVLAPGARLCPQGWLGVVSIEGSTLVTVPDSALLPQVASLTHLDPRALTDADVLRSLLPVDRVLGPARLAYLTPGGSELADDEADGQLETLPPGHPDVARLLTRSGTRDAEESGVSEVSSDTVVLRRDGRVAAASGYRRWPGDVAHLCVLTDPDTRAQGMATRVARAATAAAVADGLLPQWRAASQASVRTARRLGFVVLGAQLSVALHRAS